MPGYSGGPVVTMLVCPVFILHARLRVRRASGIPRALDLKRCARPLGRKVHAQLGRPAPRERGVVFGCLKTESQGPPRLVRNCARGPSQALAMAQSIKRRPPIRAARRMGPCVRRDDATHPCFWFHGSLRRGATFQSSSSAKADDPVIRGVDDGIERRRFTGYPACAGYDGASVSLQNVSRGCCD
jgi:hypothetical protein